ncbi:MAG: threonine--tRNA ligase [Candidatus Lokiarchaeota archaeon]|nr:threonine--tRNA ligase [Candidatus Lokiarchaeota archaeon]
MIHSDGAFMEKKMKATSSPQDFKEKDLKIDGLVLFAFVSVEDQDIFDTSVIAKQGANVIEDAIELIEGFPDKIEEHNKEIREFNEKLEKRRKLAKDNPKIPTPTESLKSEKKLIMDRKFYTVDSILVYPWAHLSRFLSQEKESMEVCPKIASILSDRGYKADFSPFGWYKSFSLNCLGHEVAEMYRDVKLSILADEVRANSVFKILTEDGKVLHLYDPKKDTKNKDIVPDRYKGKEWKSFQELIADEVLGSGATQKKEPPHIKMMQSMELADFDDASDAGNLRWYTKGVLMKNLVKDYLENVMIENGAIYADTPVMYTVKNKKLTAQTARFPAKTYWVHSGNNRYLLRFANDFLLFNMFSQMQIREESLPLGVYEWETYSFRREQKGELSGLRRLRAFVMPDLHTLCKDLPQSVKEFKKEFEMVQRILKDLGINSHIVFRATEQFWEENNDWIIKSIKEWGQPAIFELWPERYYYFILKFEWPVIDSQGKSATLSTIQIDVESSQDYIEQFGEKRQKYNIIYTSKDGSTGHPIILHTSPSGAFCRIIWALLESNEKYKDEIVTGFKTWLSPVQVRVIPITDKDKRYAEKIMIKLNDVKIRADYDDRDEKIGKKIRSAEVEWIPYTIIVGSKERQNNTISVRKRLIGEKLVDNKTNEQIQDIKLADLKKIINKELKGFPRKELPIPFRYYSKKISFR